MLGETVVEEAAVVGRVAPEIVVAAILVAAILVTGAAVNAAPSTRPVGLAAHPAKPAIVQTYPGNKTPAVRKSPDLPCVLPPRRLRPFLAPVHHKRSSSVPDTQGMLPT